VEKGGQENIYIRASHSAHSVYNVGILTYPYDIYVHVNSVCTLKVRIWFSYYLFSDALYYLYRAVTALFVN